MINCNEANTCEQFQQTVTLKLTMSAKDEGLIPVLEDQADHNDIIAVTVEPSLNKEHHPLDDSSSLSSISSAPSVDHFNISVRTPNNY